MTRTLLYEDLSSNYHRLRSIPHRLRRSNTRLIRDHFNSPGPHTLQLACGDHLLPGWLNSDRSATDAVVYVDLTRPFPFKDDSFDYVYSEHAIEHISSREGLGMLREVLRVLKPGGRLRIVMPDFVFLRDLHRPDRTELHQA